MKTFLVKISTCVELPFEESFLGGKINLNHLMYLSQKKADDESLLDSYKLHYDFFYREQEKNSPLKQIPLSPQRKQEEVTLKQCLENKDSI